MVQATGRTGWYYRVLRPGVVAPTDSLQRIDSRSPDWTIERIWRAFHVDTLRHDELAKLAVLPHLAQGWRNHARRRIETNSVEDWTFRLTGQELQ